MSSSEKSGKHPNLAKNLYQNKRIAENVRKCSNFDNSYLSKRLDIEIKWNHFGKQTCRATTYAKMNDKIFTSDPLPSPSLINEARGRGPRVKKYFSPIFTYVVAMLILYEHLPLNSQRLLRYDPPKLGQFRPFSPICIRQFAYRFFHSFKNLSH